MSRVLLPDWPGFCNSSSDFCAQKYPKASFVWSRCFLLMTVFHHQNKQQLHIDGFKESFEKSIETASTTQEANRSWQMKVYFEIPGCLR